MPGARRADYDLAVLGGGTAGLVASAGAAALGARVILFEREALGGDCLWTGCVPTKALIRSARVRHESANAARYGLTSAAPPFEYRQVVERMRAVRRAIEPHDSPSRFRGLGVDVVLESASLAGEGRVRCASREIRARRILIATGSRAAAPPVAGLEDTGYLTHVTALELETLPARLLILGGGPIGLEFAQLFRRLGADVTVVEQAPTLLPAEDPELTETLRALLEAEGIRIRTGTAARAAGRAPDGRVWLEAAGERLTGDALLVATGRRANTEGLGLDVAGVEVGRDGIVVDRAMRTSARGIFAAGDVTGGLRFTHVADYEARLVVANALVPLVRRRADYGAVPWVTFTDPELARVGLTEAEARERLGDGVRAYTYDLSDFDRALIDGAPHGRVKLVADRRGRLVGAHILAADAGAMIAAPALAVRRRLKLGDVADTVLAYPTFPEAVKRAAELSLRAKLETTGGRLLRRVVRWRGV